MPLHPHLNSIQGYAPEFVQTMLAEAMSTKAEIPVYGIVGLQGTGKSTLSAQMAALAKQQGIHAVVLSIDDFYLGKRERKALGRRVHPLLAMRGPPGTHDVALACAVIDSLKHAQPTNIPRFDKISDQRLPPSRWLKVQSKVDLIIFEGWFLLAQPESKNALQLPLNVLERDQDKDGVWRGYCNRALANYHALWQRLDHTVFLQGPAFQQVKTWRWQQEQSLQAANPNRKTMTQSEVEDFILYFQRVSEHVMRTLPELAQRVIRLDSQRNIISDSFHPL